MKESYRNQAGISFIIYHLSFIICHLSFIIYHLSFSVALPVALLLSACSGSRRPSEAELQRKVDSVERLENLRMLKLQGVNLEEANPLQVFYDSLEIQSLPVSLNDIYLQNPSNFTIIPQTMAQLLGFEGTFCNRAVALPESVGTRLMLLLAQNDEEDRSLWLYSLGEDYLPVDKLQLYSSQLETQLAADGLSANFYITSDYQIGLSKSDTSHKNVWEAHYIIDSSRLFMKY
jgi:hypothetical protein